MRKSSVVLTDDEVKAQMKADNASTKDIQKALSDRQANADAVQQEYDKKTSAPYIKGLADG